MRSYNEVFNRLCAFSVFEVWSSTTESNQTCERVMKLMPIFYLQFLFQWIDVCRKLCSHPPFSFNPLATIVMRLFLIRNPPRIQREEMSHARISHYVIESRHSKCSLTILWLKIKIQRKSELQKPEDHWQNDAVVQPRRGGGERRQNRPSIEWE